MKSMVVTTLMANKIRTKSQKKFEESNLDIKSLNEIIKILEKSENLSAEIRAEQYLLTFSKISGSNIVLD